MKKHFIIPSAIAALVLWIFGLDNYADENLRFIRLFAFSAAFWCAFGDPKTVFSRRSPMQVILPMVVVMLLYNPLFPVHLDYYKLYATLNIVTGMALLWCAFQREKQVAEPTSPVDPAKEPLQNITPEPQEPIPAMDEMNNPLLNGSADDDFQKAHDALTGTQPEDPIRQEGVGSKESPVIIYATKSRAGVDAEYAWISQRHGAYEQDWKRKASISYNGEDGTPCELITAETTDGAEFTYHFDISRFFGQE